MLAESPRQTPANGCLPTQSWEEITDPAEDLFDAVAAEQRRDWLAGRRTPVADRLRRYPDLAADPGQAAALVFQEFLLRQELEESPDWEGYLQKFPEYAPELGRLREVDQFVHQQLAAAAPALPTSHFGDNELLRELGRGGMGVVYLARQTKLDRLVALKVIRAGEHSSGEERRRFDGEARAVARLQHPHIVQIFDLGEVGGCPYFAMEYVEGLSLARGLVGTPWPARQAAALVEVLARAMHYAHGQGIVHRDLKPANVLLTADGTPKVSDFGLAKCLDGHGASTQTGTAMGTPSYMAPEQAASKARRVGPAADVYALGAILYELLTGRPPFRAETAVETALQVLNEEPVRPGRLRPGLPRDLETVCLKCLEKDPRRRFASAEDLADDLRHFQEGKPVRARPVGVVGRAARWCRLRPAVAALLAGLVLGFVLILVLFGLTLVAWSREEAARRRAEDQDEQTRKVLDALVGPDRLTSYQPPAARRSWGLDQLQRTAAYYETLLRQRPADVRGQSALANVYANLSLLHYERWQPTEVLALGDRTLGRPRSAAVHSPNLFSYTRTVMNDVYGGAVELHHDIGQFADALVYADKALGLTKRLADAHPRYFDFRARLAEAYHWKGLLHRHKAEPEPALHAFQQACAVLHALAQEEPSPEVRYNLARARRLAGEILHTLGRMEEAFGHVEASRTLLSELLAGQPEEKLFRDQLAQTWLLLGHVHNECGTVEATRRCWRQAYALWKEWVTPRPDDAAARQALAPYAEFLINDTAVEPFYSEAVGPYEVACKAIARLVEDEPTNRGLRQQLEMHYNCLAVCHDKAGQAARRVAAREQYAQFLETLAKREPREPDIGLDLGLACGKLAVAYREAFDTPKAERAGRRGFDLLQACRPGGPVNASTAGRVFRWSIRACSAAHEIRRGGLPEEALELAERARQLFDQLLQESPENPRYAIGLFHAYEELGRAHIALQRPEDARAAWVGGVAVMREAIRREPAKLGYRFTLARRCLNLGRHLRERARLAEAAEWLLEGKQLLPRDTWYGEQVSREFALLAAEVGQGCSELAPAEQEERDRYLRLSARTPSEIPFSVPQSQDAKR
jgi:serine/threonine-protein kinase